MSMLAEKRQRKSWILNPRSTAWTNDSNKFGQKMLEKMGWTPGKGLGANEQGMVDILRVKYKNDFKGLGCNKKVEDWVKTQEDFNSLLEELGGGDEKKKVGEKSLEKTSKSIKSRVHYHKFARGKDLSKYSAEDLKSILGLNADVKSSEEFSIADNEINNYDNLVNSSDDQVESNEKEGESVFSENDQTFGKRKKRKKSNVDEEQNFENSLPQTEKNNEKYLKRKKKKKKKMCNENME